MNVVKKNNFKKLFYIGALLAFIAGGLAYYTFLDCGPIYEFDYERDAQDIFDVFRENWYWLTTSKNYSTEYVLRYLIPDKSPLYPAKLAIKVLRDNNAFAGFVAYYMVNPTVARLLFLAVKSEFRGKGYGEKLVRYALNDLISKGAKKILLLTRTTNYHAQNLYSRAGFLESSRDEGFVNLVYEVK